MKKTATLLIATLMVMTGNLRADGGTLFGAGSECRYLVPSEDNGALEYSTEDWTSIGGPPNLQTWQEATIGIGFAGSNSSPYHDLIFWDILGEMRYLSSSALIRIPFTINQEEIETVEVLMLEAYFDDGFVAYLNGSEVMRYNAPEETAIDARAARPQSNSLGVIPHPFDISDHRDLLVAGENIFSIQLLNFSEGNQDAFILPELCYSTSEPHEYRHPSGLTIIRIDYDAENELTDLTVGVTKGRFYQLQRSTDLLNWTDFGNVVLSSGPTIDWKLRQQSSPDAIFHRVVEVENPRGRVELRLR